MLAGFKTLEIYLLKIGAIKMYQPNCEKGWSQKEFVAENDPYATSYRKMSISWKLRDGLTKKKTDEPNGEKHIPEIRINFTLLLQKNYWVDKRKKNGQSNPKDGKKSRNLMNFFHHQTSPHLCRYW